MHYECPEIVRLGVYQLLYHLCYFRMTQSIPEIWLSCEQRLHFQRGHDHTLIEKLFGRLHKLEYFKYALGKGISNNSDLKFSYKRSTILHAPLSSQYGNVKYLGLTNCEFLKLCQKVEKGLSSVLLHYLQENASNLTLIIMFPVQFENVKQYEKTKKRFGTKYLKSASTAAISSLISNKISEASGIKDD